MPKTVQRSVDAGADAVGGAMATGFAAGAGVVTGIALKIYGWSTIASVAAVPVVAIPLLLLLRKRAKEEA